MGQISAEITASPGSLLSGNQQPVDCAVVMPDLRNFVRPHALLDAEAHATAMSAATAVLERIVGTLRERECGAIVLATIPALPNQQIGSSDLAIHGSDRRFLADLNAAIAGLAVREGLVLWDLEAIAAAVGSQAWRDPVSTNLAKSPFAIGLAPLVADRLCALLSGLAGKSRRALVLDLDNTCWGGVIGDDGMEGIVLGQGDPAGEAHLALQRHALDLRRRGIVLSVCSKNDEAVARQPFRDHPDMLLREEHIAIFQANWDDKATNLRAIADMLSLDPESLVFVDDNPAERARVRQLLPEVAVPELPEDPAFYHSCVAAGGYFENAALTSDDLNRAAAYGGNAQRDAIREKLGSYEDYLESLQMVMDARPFDAVSRARIAQLINKSNQFNLTTRRRTEAEVAVLEQDPDWLGLQFRLTDAFGDNGMISVVIVRFEGADATVDTWLMSCRVLERGVECAVLNYVVERLRAKGVRKLLGEYIPTPRNGLVRDHYAKLGFSQVGEPAGDGTTRWELDLAGFSPLDVQMEIRA